MKKLFPVLLTFLAFQAITLLNAQSKSFGPDDMKTYFIAFLNKTESFDMKSEETKSIQKEHIAYITAFYETGELKMAGPVLANKEMSEILVFDVERIRDAEKILDADPAVKAGKVTYKIVTWLGPKEIKTNFSKEQ